MTLSEFVGTVGLVFGVTGTVLGVLNYLRDRAKVVVLLQWDMEVTPGTEYDARKLWGIISVTNVGRRATYISHVALRVPKGFDHTHLIVKGGIAGKKLSEGDPSELYMVGQDGLEKYAACWRDLVAQVSDSTGKVWRSKRLRREQVPSWAKARESAG